jgi:hypothetical protein
MFRINHDHIDRILQMNDKQLVLENQLQIQNDNQHRRFHADDEHGWCVEWQHRIDWVLFEEDDDVIHVDQH